MSKLDPKDVELFLLENLNFFETRESLVSELKFKHAAGSASSLLERQVTKLRDEHKSLIKLLNTLDGDIIGEIGKGNIVFLEKCKTDWCLISSGNYKGWIDKKYIWGVKEKEIIKISFFQKFEDTYWNSVNYLNKIQKRF